MSAPKHTPGPWRVGLNRNVIPSRVEVWARKDALCVAGGLGDGPEAEANAALIASAPDLAARISTLDALLTEKQRQCDLLTDAGQTAAINLANLATQIVILRRALKATLQYLEITARPELHDDPAWAGRDSRKLAIAALAERRTEP